MNIKYNNILSKTFETIKNNFKYIIYFIILLIISIIIIQFYFYQSNQKIFEKSILYEQSKSKINSNEYDQNMELISKGKDIYGMLATLEIIKKKLAKNKYEETYSDYLKLWNENKNDNIYKTIIALQGSYNLIENISSDNIIELLSYVDESLDSFIGYRYEILFLLSIKDKNIRKKDELYILIQENDTISNTIKDRVKKINEFEKYT